MIYQAIIETDSDLSVLTVDGSGDYVIGNDIVGELAALELEWPEIPCPDGGTMMPGTRVHGNRKYNHVILKIPDEYEDPYSLLEGLLVVYGLDWEVKAMSTRDKYPWIDENDDPILDEFDVPIVDVLTEVALDNSSETFLADIEDPPGRPTLPAVVHRWGGWPELIVPA
jgi:hypothetical protein